MLKRRTLQTKLFFSYSIFLIILLLMLATPAYIYVYNNVVKSTNESITRSASSISQKLNNFVEACESITKQIYSNENFRESLEIITDSSDEVEIGESYKEINNDMQVLAWINSQMNRITIFNSRGDIFSNKDSAISVQEFMSKNSALITDVHEKAGARHIRYMDSDIWANEDATQGFSFMRWLNYEGHDMGYLEIQFNLANIIDQMHFSNLNNSKVYLFNDTQIIYPSESENFFKVENYRKAIGNRKNGEMNLKLGKDSREHVVFLYSDISGYYTLFAVPFSEIYGPLKNVRNGAIAMIGIIILITLIVYYIILRRFTKPIRELSNALNNTDILNSKIEIDNKNNSDEVELLNQSFENMRIRLKNTMNEIVATRTLQLETHFEALQTQMNPHFMFNTLGIIKISCEDHGAKEAAYICGKLSSFLRYMVSTQKAICTVREELDFTREYLELMKFRYTHRLNYTIEVAEDLSEYEIPKLTLQPLVENSITHGFASTDGEMKIMIYGKVNSGFWEIILSDNGSGFTGDAIESITQKIQKYQENIHSNSGADKFSIGGMGIVNTFARLKLLYKDNINFEIGNRTNNEGAVVRLTGKVKNHIQGGS